MSAAAAPQKSGKPAKAAGANPAKAGGGAPKGSSAAPRSGSTKPSPEHRDSQLAAIEAELTKLKAERDAFNATLKEAYDATKDGADVKKGAREAMNAARDAQAAAKLERDAAQEAQKKTLQGIDLARAEEKKARETIKFDSVEEIDQAIRKCEDRIQAGGLALKDEKQVVREIEVLRASKKQLDGLKLKKLAVAKAQEVKQAADQKLSEKRSKLEAASAAYTKAREALNKLDAESQGNKIPELKTLRAAVNDKIDKLMEKRQAVHTEWSRVNNEWYKAEQERRRVQEEKYKAAQEEAKAAQEERRKQREEEEAKIKPYTEEIRQCDLLVAHLESLLGLPSTVTFLEDAAEGEAPAASSAAALPADLAAIARKVKPAPVVKPDSTLSKLQPLQRTAEDDYLVIPSGKQPRNAAPKATPPSAAAKAEDPVIVYDMDLLKKFAQLGIKEPRLHSQAKEAIQALKAKRDWFDKAPRPAKKEAAAATSSTPSPPPAAAASEKPARKANNNKSPEEVLRGADVFPSLPGSKDAEPAKTTTTWISATPAASVLSAGQQQAPAAAEEAAAPAPEKREPPPGLGMPVA